MACQGNSGILSIPIYSYIDATNTITIEHIKIRKNNEIDIKFSYAPSSKTENKSTIIVEHANDKFDDTEGGYRENYNERYD